MPRFAQGAGTGPSRIRRRATLETVSVAVVLRLVTAAWVAVEVGLVVRERRHRDARATLDRGSYALLAIAIPAAVVIAIPFSRSAGAEPRLRVRLALVTLGLPLRLSA